jgi:hypothetical protein
VHSSTSSFRHNAPHAPMLASLVLKLVVIVTAFILIETFWRSEGHEPSVLDNTDNWCVERELVLAGGSKTLVLLGNSRVLVFSPKTFRTLYPEFTLVQLGIAGKDPLDVLRDIADEKDFKGSVLCAVDDRAFTPEQHSAADYLRYYHRAWSLDRMFNRLIETELQERFACLNPRVGLQNVAEQLHLTGRLPKPLYAIRHADRHVEIYFDSPSIIDELRLDPDLNPRTDGFEIPPPDHMPVTSEVWLAQAREFSALATRIQARGGKVAFVVLPVSGTTRKTMENYYPREKYWNEFAKLTSAPTIHFEDVSDLNAINTPDTSHVGQRDAPAFTETLCKELKQVGLLQNE